jgi:hypothetical protein
MRTTIRLNDDLLAQAKQVAAQTGRTLTAVVEDALRQVLSRRRTPPKRRRTRLISSGEGWLRPGVNLDNSGELLDIMDAVDVAP